jgi:hypothetical protein
MDERVCAREVPARSSTPKNRKRIVMERRNFAIEALLSE